MIGASLVDTTGVGGVITAGIVVLGSVTSGFFVGGEVHAAKAITSITAKMRRVCSESEIKYFIEVSMWLLAVEALGAFFLFAFIVWWTMFSGQKPPSKPQDKIEKKSPPEA